MCALRREGQIDFTSKSHEAGFPTTLSPVCRSEIVINIFKYLVPPEDWDDESEDLDEQLDEDRAFGDQSGGDEEY